MDELQIIRSEIAIDSSHRDKEISELKESLNFAHGLILELRRSNQSLQEDLSAVKTDLSALQLKVATDHQRVVYLDDNSRRNSLRFKGVAEAPRENWEQCQALIVRLLREVLGISSDIERAHRLGPKTQDSGNREIIVKFTRYPDKEYILNNKKRFESKRITIREDFSVDTKALRASFSDRIRTARNEGQIAYAKYRKLVIHRPRGNHVTRNSHGSHGTRDTYNAYPANNTRGTNGAHGAFSTHAAHGAHGSRFIQDVRSSRWSQGPGGDPGRQRSRSCRRGPSPQRRNSAPSRATGAVPKTYASSVAPPHTHSRPDAPLINTNNAQPAPLWPSAGFIMPPLHLPPPGHDQHFPRPQGPPTRAPQPAEGSNAASADVTVIAERLAGQDNI